MGHGRCCRTLRWWPTCRYCTQALFTHTISNFKNKDTADRPAVCVRACVRACACGRIQSVSTCAFVCLPACPAVFAPLTSVFLYRGARAFVVFVESRCFVCIVCRTRRSCRR